jgi:hypothetical protein
MTLKLSELNRQILTADNQEQIEEAIDELFTFKPWDAEKIEQGKMVREGLSQAYGLILANVPPCPTRTRALNLLVDCRMLANAAITFEGEV